MHVDIVMWVVVGLIAGWLAGSTMKGNGYGLAGDIAVAAVGAIVGVWLVVFLVAEADRGGYGLVLSLAALAVIGLQSSRSSSKRSA